MKIVNGYSRNSAELAQHSEPVMENPFPIRGLFCLILQPRPVDPTNTRKGAFISLIIRVLENAEKIPTSGDLEGQLRQSAETSL
jgi:hypothetical protein